MAYSINTFSGTGNPETYALSFALGILSRDDVQCRVGNEVDGLGDPVYRTINWITDGLVTISGTTPALGQSVVFTRTVSKDALIHDYANGAAIEERNLDESNKQTLMALQEFIDGRTPGLTGALDLQGNKIINISDGVLDTDAPSLGQLRTVEDNAVDAAAAAVASANAASVSANSAAAAASSANAAFDGGMTLTTTNPRYILAGDSLLKNHLASGTFEGLLTANAWNGMTPVLINLSVVGRSIKTWLETYRTAITPSLSLQTGKNIVILEGGHNDYNSGYTAAESAGRMIRLSRELRELGVMTIVVTLASCGPALKDAWRTEFNNYIMSEWFHHFDDVATFHLDLDMGLLGTYTNLTYFNPDQNHYTLAGYTREASYVQAALDRIVVKHNSGIVNFPGGDLTSIAIGFGALSNQNTTDKYNVAVGIRAMLASLASAGNVAVGYEALNKSTDANNNVVIGYRAGYNLTTGDSNVGVGHQSLLNATTGQANAAFGARSLEALIDGNDNTAIGYHAGMSVTSGTGNLLIGKNVADNVLQSGSNNTLIGNDLDTSAAGTNNWFNLDNLIVGDKTKFLSMLGGQTIIGILEGANFNSTADQAIPIQLPFGATKYVITNVWVKNPSTNMNVAAGGFYSAAGKAGTLIVASTQVYTALTAANKLQRCVVANPGGQDTVLNTANLYFSLTTPQGAAATADIILVGVPIP